VQIHIDAVDLPGSSCGPSPDRPEGHENIHVGVQRRGRPDEILNLVRADAEHASWTLECTAAARATGIDLKGPCIQGSPGKRFIYLSWGTVDGSGSFSMFRRAKLLLDAVPADVLSAAMASGTLVGHLGLTDEKGNPTCAAVKPDKIMWSASPPA
jgi:hypothetical protein